MDDCLFCKIAAGQIPSNKLYEDDQLLAFYDIDPQAPTHFLVIPKQHIDSAAALTEKDAALLGHIHAHETGHGTASVACCCLHGVCLCSCKSSSCHGRIAEDSHTLRFFDHLRIFFRKCHRIHGNGNNRKTSGLLPFFRKSFIHGIA